MCVLKAINDNHKTTNLNLPASILGNLQIFEMKQLADKEATYRTLCQQALTDYKNWQKDQQDQTDVIELLYQNLEGQMQRAKALHAIELYWTIRRHFREALNVYLEKTQSYQMPYKKAA